MPTLNTATINKPQINIAQLAIDRSKPVQNNFSLAAISLKSTSAKIIIMLVSIIVISCFYWFNRAIATPQKADKVQSEIATTSQTAKVKIDSAPSINNSVSKINKMTKVLDASGHIVARRIASVSSEITGKLEQLYIEEGQQVVKNQVLAELDDEQAKISYQLALAKLAAQQANVDESKISLQYQQQRLERNKELVRKNLISQQLTDDSEVKTAKIKALLNNRMALVKLAEQQVDLALYQLKHHKIRAPFSGVVISKNAQVGELISTGSSAGGSIRTGVGTIVDMSSLEIEVEVGESYINRVFAGQKTIATLDAYPDWQIKSEVVAVIPTANRQKASIKVRIKLLTNDPRIFPDMGIKVSFLKS
jgi:RND family efflux transporter MFP subunit